MNNVEVEVGKWYNYGNEYGGAVHYCYIEGVTSDEYMIRENIPPVIILFLIGFPIYILSGLNRCMSNDAIIFILYLTLLLMTVLYTTVVMYLYQYSCVCMS